MYIMFNSLDWLSKNHNKHSMLYITWKWKKNFVLPRFHWIFPHEKIQKGICINFHCKLQCIVGDSYNGTVFVLSKLKTKWRKKRKWTTIAIVSIV